MEKLFHTAQYSFPEGIDLFKKLPEADRKQIKPIVFSRSEKEEKENEKLKPIEDIAEIKSTDSHYAEVDRERIEKVMLSGDFEKIIPFMKKIELLHCNAHEYYLPKARQMEYYNRFKNEFPPKYLKKWALFQVNYSDLKKLYELKQKHVYTIAITHPAEDIIAAYNDLGGDVEKIMANAIPNENANLVELDYYLKPTYRGEYWQLARLIKCVPSANYLNVKDALIDDLFEANMTVAIMKFIYNRPDLHTKILGAALRNNHTALARLVSYNMEHLRSGLLNDDIIDSARSPESKKIVKELFNTVISE